MPFLATDWATYSSLATAGGTLVLALATFAAVRSSNRSTRIAEATLREQRRPLLSPSRLDDPVQKAMYLEGHWVSAAGGRGVAEHIDGTVYLALSVKNVGSGIGVCQGWLARAGFGNSTAMASHSREQEFHLQARDHYVPAGDVGMWQGALRNPDDPVRAEIIEAIETRQPISIELLYSDQVGSQRTITRFGLVPAKDTWLAYTNRHWYLEWNGPRPETDALAAAAAALRDQEAVAERRAAQQAEATASAVEDGNDNWRSGILPDYSETSDLEVSWSEQRGLNERG